MINSLIQYFIKNGHLDMPGIGSLRLFKEEAYWENNQLIAPKEKIVLDPVANKPSKDFFIFLADYLGLSVDQAILQFDAFINQFISQTIASLTIGNLGTLHKNASQISWNNLYHSEYYFNNVETIVSETSNEDSNEFASERKIGWWIWAIIISIISIALIFYKQSM
jgi:hypothetical protein